MRVGVAAGVVLMVASLGGVPVSPGCRVITLRGLLRQDVRRGYLLQQSIAIGCRYGIPYASPREDSLSRRRRQPVVMPCQPYAAPVAQLGGQVAGLLQCFAHAG